MSIITIQSGKSTLTINDANDDDMFDAGDKVSLDDKEISNPLDSERIQKFFKSMGMDSAVLSIARLHPFQHYISSFQSAEYAAKKGDSYTVSNCLSEARNDAEKAKIEFDEDRANSPMIKAAYKRGYEGELQLANAAADKGDAGAISAHLSQAKGYAVKAGIKIDQNQVNSPRIRKGYKLAYEEEFRLAEDAANRNSSAFIISQHLGLARWYAAKAEFPFEKHRAAKLSIPNP